MGETLKGSFFVFGTATSVTRLGDFQMYLVTNSLKEVAQRFGHFLGYFEKLYS